MSKPTKIFTRVETEGGWPESIRTIDTITDDPAGVEIWLKSIRDSGLPIEGGEVSIAGATEEDTSNVTEE